MRGAGISRRAGGGAIDRVTPNRWLWGAGAGVAALALAAVIVALTVDRGVDTLDPNTPEGVVPALPPSHRGGRVRGRLRAPWARRRRPTAPSTALSTNSTGAGAYRDITFSARLADVRVRGDTATVARADRRALRAPGAGLRATLRTALRLRGAVPPRPDGRGLAPRRAGLSRVVVPRAARPQAHPRARGVGGRKRGRSRLNLLRAVEPAADVGAGGHRGSAWCRSCGGAREARDSAPPQCANSSSTAWRSSPCSSRAAASTPCWPRCCPAATASWTTPPRRRSRSPPCSPARPSGCCSRGSARGARGSIRATRGRPASTYTACWPSAPPCSRDPPSRSWRGCSTSTSAPSRWAAWSPGRGVGLPLARPHDARRAGRARRMVDGAAPPLPSTPGRAAASR